MIKKFRGLSMILVIAILVSMVSVIPAFAADGPGGVLDFYNFADYDSYLFSGLAGCSNEWEDNALKTTCDGSSDIGDMYFYLNEVADFGIEAEEYPYFAINIKNPTAAKEVEAHFGTSDSTLGAGTVFHCDIDAEMTDYKTFVCYIPDKNIEEVNYLNAPGGLNEKEGQAATVSSTIEESAWHGTLTSFRYDSLYFGGRSGEAKEGDTSYVRWIAFFKTEEDAKAYAGPARGADVTPVPTAAPDDSNFDSVGLLRFDHEDDLFDEFFAGASRNGIEDVSFDEEKKCYAISVVEGGDPFIEMNIGNLIASGDYDEISANEYKVLQMGVRVNTKEGSTNGQLYYGTDEHPGYSEAQSISYKYKTTDDIQCVNMNLTKQKAWSGMVANCRYDPFGATNTDTIVEVYFIQFFTTMDAAEAFAATYAEKGNEAFPATPVPTQKPTPVPTQVPTEAPKVTPSEAPATDAPATEAPKDNGGEKSNTSESGSSNTGIIIAVVAAVVVAVAVVAIVLIKKKKAK